MKVHLPSGLIGALLLAATPALADDQLPSLPPPAAQAPPAGVIDAVHLRNGGLYRGHVTEIVPGDHVTIYVERGDEKKIPWSEIDRVIVATTPVPPPPSGGDAVGSRTIPPATPPVSAPMVGPKVRVHVSSPSTVILYRRAAGTTSWTQACVSPCNVELPLNDSYRVVGNNVSQSSEFNLTGSPGGSVDLKVDPQSTGGMVMGGLVGGAGALIGYVGLLVTLVSISDSGSSSSDKEARGAGLVMMALGSLATLGGVLLFIASAKTDVAVTSGGSSTAKADPPKNDAWKRVPTWRTAETGAAPAQFPLLFSRAF